jgi:hypothetical protein
MVSVDTSQKVKWLSQTLDYLPTERQLAQSKNKETNGESKGQYRGKVREARII